MKLLFQFPVKFIIYAVVTLIFVLVLSLLFSKIIIEQHLTNIHHNAAQLNPVENPKEDNFKENSYISLPSNNNVFLYNGTDYFITSNTERNQLNEKLKLGLGSTYLEVKVYAPLDVEKIDQIQKILSCENYFYIISGLDIGINSYYAIDCYNSDRMDYFPSVPLLNKYKPLTQSDMSFLVRKPVD